jgi:hypothetical protein
MKNIIIKSLMSVRKKIDPNNRKNCFELFGYDFIIDDEFNPFLIEVNTNPCLEESSTLLKIILRRMMDDLMKLTIDLLFLPKRKSKPSPKKSSPKKMATSVVAEK